MKKKRLGRRRNTIRIIAGTWRGRRIPVAAGTSVRPTPDRVRETVFNWLGEGVAGARCLDLFAGTGAMGLEALSRGAKEACFVEADGSLCRSLEAQLALLEATATVVQGDVERFLDGTIRESFDIVFLDPPYEQPLEPVLGKLASGLSSAARIYVERKSLPGPAAPLNDLAAALPGASLVRQGRAGQVLYGLLALDK